MSDVRPNNLWVHEDRGVTKHLGERSASIADLVAAFLNEGGEIVRAFKPSTEPSWTSQWHLTANKPGRYLVYPLEDE